MRLKDGFLLRKIAGEYVVVPTGDSMVDFKAMISLNETGAFLWKQLEEEKSEQQLADAMISEYDIDKDTALSDIGEFAALLREKNLLI